VTDPRVDELKSLLVAAAGGFLRNMRRSGTCRRCFTPVADQGLCLTCAGQVALPGGPDALGFLTYAGFFDPIRQAGRAMWDYKRVQPSQQKARNTVALLAALGLRGYRDCPARLVGFPLNAWATVPSLPPKEGQHTLNEIVDELSRPGSRQVVLRGDEAPEHPHTVRADHFRVETHVPAGCHVLLVEDTWVSGGHALSATLALRRAGAQYVSLLALARWLDDRREATTPAWVKRHLAAPDYAAETCP
jgi:predicted amidophosphoribosyltransferase